MLLFKHFTLQKISEYISKLPSERKAHLRLDTPCCHRGGHSTEFRGLLAYFLDTEIPTGCVAVCCHACHNPDCSNPEHLYWGTVKENLTDAYENRGAEIRAAISRGLSGDLNPNYGKRPWRITGGKMDGWRKAGKIYNENTDRDWSKYGSGPSFLQRKYGLAQGSAKTMIQMLRQGWNPYLDHDWSEDFGDA